MEKVQELNEDMLVKLSEMYIFRKSACKIGMDGVGVLLANRGLEYYLICWLMIIHEYRNSIQKQQTLLSKCMGYISGRGKHSVILIKTIVHFDESSKQILQAIPYSEHFVNETVEHL